MELEKSQSSLVEKIILKKVFMLWFISFVISTGLLLSFGVFGYGLALLIQLVFLIVSIFSVSKIVTKYNYQQGKNGLTVFIYGLLLPAFLDFLFFCTFAYIATPKGGW